MEFNFQTFIHSCFIHIYCSCRIRMDASSISLLFFLLCLTVSCNPSYELWISTLLEIFTSPTVMILWGRTGLSLDACLDACMLISLCIFLHTIQHINLFFLKCLVGLYGLKLRSRSTSVHINNIHSAAEQVSEYSKLWHLQTTLSEQGAALGTPPHVEQRQLTLLPHPLTTTRLSPVSKLLAFGMLKSIVAEITMW